MEFMNTGDGYALASTALAPLGFHLQETGPSAEAPETVAILQLPDGTNLPVHARASERWEFAPDAPGERVIVQPYINPRMAERYRSKGVFYADLAGNMWIWTNSVKILLEGKRRPDTPQPRNPTTGLTTPSELRVVFALLNDPAIASHSIRALADRAAVSLGATHKTYRALRDHGYITGHQHTLRRRGQLTELWLAGFTSRLLPKLRARTVGGTHPTDLLEAISEHHLDFTPAGEATSPAMHSRSSVAVYGTPPWTDLVRLKRLTPDPEGPITLRERFWNPTTVTITPDGQSLLTCGELLAATDERLREAGTTMRRDLP